MPDVSDTVNEAVERGRESHLNSAVAILVALTATFMALCNVKDGNITQGMAQAQAQAVDTWSYYQSKSIKAHLAEQTLDQLQIQRAFTPAPAIAAIFASSTAGARACGDARREDRRLHEAGCEGKQRQEEDPGAGRRVPEGLRPPELPRRSVRHVGRGALRDRKST